MRPEGEDIESFYALIGRVNANWNSIELHCSYVFERLLRGASPGTSHALWRAMRHFETKTRAITEVIAETCPREVQEAWSQLRSELEKKYASRHPVAHHHVVKKTEGKLEKDGVRNIKTHVYLTDYADVKGRSSARQKHDLELLLNNYVELRRRVKRFLAELETSLGK